MLRAMLAAACAVCLIYSPSSAKKSQDERILTITSPASGPTDGSLLPDARFAFAAANTTVLYTANFNSGVVCTPQGWTVADAMMQVGTFWHVDDFVGVDVHPGDNYAPINGAKSLWCGVRAESVIETCYYAVLPGYGNFWNQAWRTKDCLTLNGSLDLAFDMHLDSEPEYDPAYLEYTSACDADYRDNSWMVLEGGYGVWDGLQDISHAESYSVGAGPVRVRIRFFSDGGYSDEDALFDSHSGPIVLDNLVVEGLVENFEDEFVGETSSDDWEADLHPGFGSYFALFPGASLVQQDACAKNLSCVWAAISGSTDSYACGGFPQQAAVPYGPNDYGQYIEDAIISPPIALTGTGSRVNLQFSVYRDLSLDDLVFYYWEIRSVVNGCPGPWRNRGFRHFGDQKDWKVETFPVGDLIEPGATHIQARLGVSDLCSVYCDLVAPCHSHAPLFDNVNIYRVDITGPIFTVSDVDMFQDTFPVDGSDTGIGRADMARSITASTSPTILPGDSVKLIVSDPLTAVAVTNPSGLATDNLGGTGNQAGTNGNKACYVYVHVIDSGVPSAVKTGALLSGGPSYPFKDTVAADGKTWTRIQCWLRVTPSVFVVDLNDNLFEAGDEIQFFFGATNTNGQTTYCSGSALDYVQNDVDVAAASASEFTILPLNANGTGGNEMLYVDGMDGRGAQVYWDTAFEQFGLAPDRYDVRGPTSSVSNRPGTRVKDVNQQLNANYQFIFWDTGDLTQGLGDGTGAPEKSNDYAMLNGFLGGLSTRGGVYLCGDDLPSSLLAMTGAAAVSFRSTYITFTLTTGDHRPTFGISPTGIGTPGGAFAGDTIVISGGCPLLNDFDVMTPTGSTTTQMTYGAATGSNAAVIRKGVGDANVGLSGFSFIYIRDDETDGVLDRADHLKGISCLAGDCFNNAIVDVPRDFANRLEQNYPNPFNPQTTIAFSIKERGRVRIDVFNVAGERVRTLLDETRAAGSYQDVVWDGRSDVNQPVASGVYWYRIVAGSFSQSRKMVLLK